MRRWTVILLSMLALLGGAALVAWNAVQDVTGDALRAYPVYAFVRTRNIALAGAEEAGLNGMNLLIPRTTLAGPRDMAVTTPNNDTLYSSAFLDLSRGPVLLTAPALPDRYHSIAIMDARTDHALLTGTRDKLQGGRFLIRKQGSQAAAPAGARIVDVPTDQAWLLIRVLVDGSADQPMAEKALLGFRLDVPPASRAPVPVHQQLPVLPDATTLAAATKPLFEANPVLGEPVDPDAGLKRRIWDAVLPRIWQRLQQGIAEGTSSSDGWSKTPPGIGTAQASPQVRAAVALGGLGALPATEAIYWRASRDADGQPLDGSGSYTLMLPARIPAGAFWSLSMYRRMPDGRLFYVENKLNRYAVGDRTPGLMRNPDGSLTLTISHADPGTPNWLPAPKGLFNLVFRVYIPEAAIQAGDFHLMAVQRKR